MRSINSWLGRRPTSCQKTCISALGLLVRRRAPGGATAPVFVLGAALRNVGVDAVLLPTAEDAHRRPVLGSAQFLHDLRNLPVRPRAKVDLPRRVHAGINDTPSAQERAADSSVAAVGPWALASAWLLPRPASPVVKAVPPQPAEKRPAVPGLQLRPCSAVPAPMP